MKSTCFRVTGSCFPETSHFHISTYMSSSKTTKSQGWGELVFVTLADRQSSDSLKSFLYFFYAHFPTIISLFILPIKESMKLQ